VATCVNNFRTTAAALAFRLGQNIQLGTMGEEGEIAMTLWAVFWGFSFQVTRASSLAEVVLQPAAEATAVFGPDVDSHADAGKRREFKRI